MDDKSTELAKAKEKLRISQSGFDKAAALLAEAEKQIIPLNEQIAKLKRDTEYYQSRIAKYQRMLGEEK